MSERDDFTPTPEERAAQDAVRGLPRPAADPAFRAALKRSFASGELASRPARRIVLPMWRRPAMLPAFAAAAAAVVMVVAMMNRGPAWEVVRSEGEGIAIVNGRPVAMKHGDEIAAALARGGRVRIPDDGLLELVAPGQVAVRLAAGADLDLPPSPNRWFSRTSEAVLRRGDLFATTGPGFPGARLDLRTELAHVLVTGTSFAVLAHEGGTCVCVMDGTVRVAGGDRPMEVVPAGERCFVTPDGRPPTHHPVLDSSLHALHELSSDMAERLGR